MGIVHARQLAAYIASLDGFIVRPRTGANYDHMGAIICDSILQAGLNYATVVAPRVRSLMRRWPKALRTSVFASMSKRFGLGDVLNWRDPEKPRRIVELTSFLIRNTVETESELRDWLIVNGNAERLSTVRGVGPKTIDYIKSLVGVQTVASCHVPRLPAHENKPRLTYQSARKWPSNKCLDHDNLKCPRNPMQFGQMRRAATQRDESH